MSDLVLHDEGRRFVISQPGLVTETKANGDVIPWTNQGARWVIGQLERIFAQEELEAARRVIGSLPLDWSFVIEGVMCPFDPAMKALSGALAHAVPGCIAVVNPLRPEAGFSGSDGTMKVFLQQGGIPGVAKRQRRREYLQLHAVDAVHMAISIAALYRIVEAETSILSIYEEDVGHDVTTIDVSDKAQVRSFIEELQLPLTDIEFCRRKGLLDFTSFDLGQLIQPDEGDVDF